MAEGSAYAAGMSGTTIPKALPPREPALSEIMNRLSGIHEHANMLAGRMQNIADRAFGSEPQAANASTPREVPNGGVGTIMQRIDDIGATLSTQAAILARLEQIA